MKIDQHVHSSEISPCARLTIREVMDIYGETDYDAIVLTNHFNAESAAKLAEKGVTEDFHSRYHAVIREAEEIGRERGLLVLGGYEVRFNSARRNDYLVYGMTEEQCRDYRAIFEMSPAEFSDKARREGFLFYQAHPFRDAITIIEPKLLFGMEVKNTCPRYDCRNDIANAWADKYHLHKIGGSDCHRVWGAGLGGITTDFPVKNIPDLVHVLRNDLYTII